MALMRCPDCGKMVSGKAAVCSNCGCPSSYFEEGIIDEVLSVKLDAPAPCRLDTPDLDFTCRASADCLHQHLQVI